MRARSVLVALGLCTVVCGAAGAVAIRRHPLREGARAVAAAPTAPAPRTIRAEGRVATRPGKQVQLGAELQGRVAAVHVVEGQSVKKGELLAELDCDE